MYEFRLPPATLNGSFRKLGFAALIGLGLAYLLTGSGFSTTTTIIVLIIGVGGYFYTKQHVWIRLSADGIDGTGYTGRKVKISWDQPVTLNATRMSDMDGVEIRLAENGGLLKKQVSSLFIPAPIANTLDFSTALFKLAPVGHPLRQMFSNQ
jgi:uncharacterized membrane protein